MTRLTYYPQATDTTPEATGREWTLADLSRLSRIAVARCRGWAGTYTDRYDEAWMGIAEALSSGCTDESDLINAGASAAAGWQDDHRRHHGVNNRGIDDWSPGFARYWTAAPATPFDERLTEHMALHQIWSTLTEVSCTAITALAVHGDYRKAAAAEGVAMGTYMSRVDRARSRVATAWLDGETPVRRRIDRRAPWAATYRGRPRITETQLAEIRTRYDAGESQTALAAEYGSTSSTISKLLRGTSRPAPDTRRRP